MHTYSLSRQLSMTKPIALLKFVLTTTLGKEHKAPSIGVSHTLRTLKTNTSDSIRLFFFSSLLSVSKGFSLFSPPPNQLIIRRGYSHFCFIFFYDIFDLCGWLVIFFLYDDYVFAGCHVCARTIFNVYMVVFFCWKNYLIYVHFNLQRSLYSSSVSMWSLHCMNHQLVYFNNFRCSVPYDIFYNLRVHWNAHRSADDCTRSKKKTTILTRLTFDDMQRCKHTSIHWSRAYPWNAHPFHFIWFVDICLTLFG